MSCICDLRKGVDCRCSLGQRRASADPVLYCQPLAVSVRGIFETPAACRLDLNLPANVSPAAKDKSLPQFCPCKKGKVQQRQKPPINAKVVLQRFVYEGFLELIRFGG